MLLACGQLALAMVMVGSNVVVGKLLSHALPVPVILFLRTILAAAVLAPFALRRGAAPPRPRIMANLATQALVGTLG